MPISSFVSVHIEAATVSHATTIRRGTRVQNLGSTEGGNLLWVYGTGFAPNVFREVPTASTPNSVELTAGDASYECRMYPEKVTETQLACYTPSMPVGQYQVKVRVNGNLIPPYQSNSPTFISSVTNAPKITQISPVAGLPGRLVSLSGDFKSGCYLRETEGCSTENIPFISR